VVRVPAVAPPSWASDVAGSGLPEWSASPRWGPVPVGETGPHSGVTAGGGAGALRACLAALPGARRSA